MRPTFRGLLAVLAVVVVAPVPLPARPARADATPDQVVAYNDYTTMDGLYLRDLQSGVVRHLFADGDAATPAISPDGSRVAYAAYGAAGTPFYEPQLWVAPTDTSAAPTQLTTLPCAVQSPAWSADGSKIAFGCANGGIQVIVVDSAAGVQVASVGPQAESPSFSPDGTKLVVEGNGEIYTVDLADPNQLTKIAEGVSPRWSPDGTRILYGTTGARNRLWTINPDGTAPLLLSGATPSTDSYVGSWAWSADSRTIVFGAGPINPIDSAGNADLYFIDRNGQRRWAIATTPSVNERFVSVSGALHATGPGAAARVAASASVNNASALVRWSPPGSDGGAPVTGYVVKAEDRPGGTVERLTTSTGTTAQVKGLRFGRTYYFTVAAANAEGTGPWSTATNPVTPRAHTTTVITSSTASYTYRAGRAHIAGMVIRLDTGKPAVGAVVHLQARSTGSAKPYRGLASAVADARGHVLFDGLVPRRNTLYRLGAATAGPYQGSTSVARIVTVHPAISIILSRSQVRPGSGVTVAGAVSPDQAGSPVALQRWTDGSWHRVAVTIIRFGSRYSFTVRNDRPGRYRYRVATPAVATLIAGHSRSAVLTVAG